jgi:hypothetical protein
MREAETSRPTTFASPPLTDSGKVCRSRRSTRRDKAGAIPMALVWLGILSACGLIWTALIGWIRALALP